MSIYCGTQKLKIRPLPHYEQLGAVKVGRDWRIVDLETQAVIGPPLQTYGLACEFAGHWYEGQYK